jgi:hypothetical protein
MSWLFLFALVFFLVWDVYVLKCSFPCSLEKFFGFRVFLALVASFLESSLKILGIEF